MTQGSSTAAILYQILNIEEASMKGYNFVNVVLIVLAGVGYAGFIKPRSRSSAAAWVADAGLL